MAHSNDSTSPGPSGDKKAWVILGIIGGLLLLGLFIWNFPSASNQGYNPKQPIAFSHALHAGTYGIDCRYCHVAAEISAHATVPSLNVCMNCHKAVKTDSPEIKKLTEAYNSGKPIEWVKVHRLPDHAHFKHNRHIAAGVSCETCHGQVQEMDQVYQAKALNMGWCLECHRGQTTPPEIHSWKAHELGIEKHEGPVAPFNCTTCHY